MSINNYQSSEITGAAKRAFGEVLGADVPTRYSAEIHAQIDTVMALDSLISPVVLGMSQKTVWFCRGLAALMLILRHNGGDLDLRRRLELEILTGVLLIFLGLDGTITRHFFERAYLAIGGVLMIANSLMTEVE